MRKYFQTGELPAVGTVCQPNERPLIGKIGMTQEDLGLKVEGETSLIGVKRL